MAVQFIFGGSGRGKTYFLQHKIMEEAVKNPKKDYIMIVPEQFTMQTQKDMIRISPGHGIMNVDVQSFVRLAFRVFSETGAGNVQILDDLGKIMILKKVLSKTRRTAPWQRPPRRWPSPFCPDTTSAHTPAPPGLKTRCPAPRARCRRRETARRSRAARAPPQRTRPPAVPCPTARQTADRGRPAKARPPRSRRRRPQQAPQTPAWPARGKTRTPA